MSKANRTEFATGQHLSSSYWRVWLASTGSNLGDGIRRVAFPLLAVSLTSNAFLIGLVAAAGSLPWLFSGLIAGALVDRWDRLRTMWVVQLHAMSVWGLIGAALLIGTGETFVDNAAQAVLPQLVPAQLLDRANSRLFAGQVTAGQFIGQGVSGVLFAVAAELPFAVDTVGFLFAALVISGLSRSTQTAPRAAPSGAGKGRLLDEIRAGLSWLAGQRLLRGMLMMMAALGLASGAFWAIVALYATRILHMPPTGYGIMLAIGATGALLGSFIASWIRARLGTALSIHLAVAVIGLACVGFAVTTHAVVASALLILNGTAVMMWNVIAASLRQSLTPAPMLGRVSSVFRLVAYGSMSIGAVGAGALADTVSIPAVFWASAAILAIAGLATAPAIRTARHSSTTTRPGP
jgi:MFS family permease